MTSEDKSKELFNIFDNKFINESNRVFYFFLIKKLQIVYQKMVED